jgi:hypothetical protein
MIGGVMSAGALVEKAKCSLVFLSWAGSVKHIPDCRKNVSRPARIHPVLQWLSVFADIGLPVLSRYLLLAA